MPERPALLVVGAGGLLGGAIVRRAERTGYLVHRATVPWHDAEAAQRALEGHVTETLADHRDVTVVWCAGAGVVGTNSGVLGEELENLRHCLDAMASAAAPDRELPVRFVLSSSAGGVYAGATGTRFTEDTEPASISAYGDAKLAAERMVRDWATTSGAQVVIARLANLYGPGQNLAKSQGLVSHLCRAHLERQPLMVYVPLDTARDYVYVDDAAAILLACARRAATSTPGTVVQKIVCSGQSTTLAAVLGELQRITRRSAPIVLGASDRAAAQTSDLHFRSVVWPDLDRLADTPLPVGIHATLAHTARELFR